MPEGHLASLGEEKLHRRREVPVDLEGSVGQKRKKPNRSEHGQRK